MLKMLDCSQQPRLYMSHDHAESGSYCFEFSSQRGDHWKFITRLSAESVRNPARRLPGSLLPFISEFMAMNGSQRELSLNCLSDCASIVELKPERSFSFHLLDFSAQLPDSVG